jgi:hypothetical protein
VNSTDPGGFVLASGYPTRGTALVVGRDGVLVTPDHLCPDLLRLSNIGPADGWRGRIVRGFFRLMRLWPVR